MKSYQKVLLLGLILLLVLAGCSKASSLNNPWIGRTAPDFTLQNASGQTVSLADYKGQPLLINFWAVRCPPCREEMPFLQQIYDEYTPKGLIVLTINNGETVSEVKSFFHQNQLTLPVLMDKSGEVGDSYGVYYLPATVFVDKEGIIRDVVNAPFENKADIARHLSKIMR